MQPILFLAPFLLLVQLEKQGTQTSGHSSPERLKVTPAALISCPTAPATARPSSIIVRWLAGNGSFVHKGDIVVELDNTDIRDQFLDQQDARRSADAAYARAIRLALATRDPHVSNESADEALKNVRVAKAAYQLAESREQALERKIDAYRLVAPSDGWVHYEPVTPKDSTISRILAVGERVSEGQALMRITKQPPPLR
jgi:multidrug efflux pump subunit AcrA (membrane-fusion protein)